MKNARFLRALLAQSFALYVVACGPQSVSPANDGAALSDGATNDAPSNACATPRVLLEADSRQVESIAYERVPGGYIEVTASREGIVNARLFDAQWNARGPAAPLPAPTSASPSTDARRVAVSFLADRGAISFGATLWDVSVDGTLALSVNRALRATDAGRDATLVGAWPRRMPPNTVQIFAVTTDASEWSADPTGLTRLNAGAPMVTSLSYDASVQFVFDSTTYLAFETVWHRDINNEVRVRSLIAARGGLFETSSRSEVGTAISPVVRVGDALWRLHYKRSEMVGPNDTELTLVVHDASDGATRSSTRLSESGLPLSGAIAASADGARSLLLWSREVGSSSAPAAIVAQRGEATPTELFHSPLSMTVLSAWLEESGARGWVTFASYTREATPRRTVYVQCVE